MSDTLRLSDILGRGVTVEWFEAVALVRDVADRVRETLAGQAIPELHQIELLADGRVSLSGAARTDEPVRRLGQLLQAALVQSDPPVQLRLAVSQATAPTPSFGSVREYSEALAYFERPDRTAVLQALFERASATPAGEVQLTPTLDAIAPLEDPRPKKAQRPAAEKQPVSKSRAVPAVAAAVMVVVGGTAYWQFAGAGPTTAEVSAMAVKASDAVGTALVSGLSSVSDTVGLGRLVPADGSGATPPAPAPAAPPAIAATAGRKPVGARSATPDFRLFDLSPQVTSGLPTSVLPPVPPLPVSMTSVPEPTFVPDSQVYSASDPAVTAPIGIRPQLPAVLPSDIASEKLSQIELLVLPDGTVGTVKLLGQPRSVLEGMLLSAAKAWRFSPALKDGHPVAYRKLVWLVLE